MSLVTDEVQRAPAITKDNVDLVLDAVVYLRIVDPYKAAYAVDDPVTAMLILAQTTVRSRIGEMTLDQTFKNREELNARASAVTARFHPVDSHCTRAILCAHVPMLLPLKPTNRAREPACTLSCLQTLLRCSLKRVASGASSARATK